MACMIEFSCVQQDLKRVDEKTVAEGASVVSAKFELCGKWDGLTVYARFRHGASCFDVALAEGVALIPWEVLKPTGFEVSVWGEDGEGGKLTSASLFVDVARTVSLDAFEPIPSSPTLIGAFTEKAAAAAEAARIAQEANAATVAIGTVETGAAGTDASVTNSGTGMSAVFDFVIPRGEKGETGDGLPEGGEVGQVVTLSESGAVWADPQGGSVDIDFPITVAQGGTGATSAAAAIVSLGAAAAEHDHDAGDIASGTLSVERGGTGAATAETARANLGVTLANLGAAAENHEHTASDITSGLLPISNGGTGASTAAGALENLGAAAACVVLYDSDAGTCDTITLSESAANFEYLEIYPKMNDGVYAPLVKVNNPNGKSADVSWLAAWASGSVAVSRARVVISGNQITFKSNCQVTMTENGHSVYTEESYLVRVTRVVGYR